MCEEAQSALSVAVVVGTVAEHACENNLLAALVVPCVNTILPKVEIVCLHLVLAAVDDHACIVDAGVEVGCNLALVKHTEVGLRIEVVNCTIGVTAVLCCSIFSTLSACQIQFCKEVCGCVLGDTTELLSFLWKILDGISEVANHNLPCLLRRHSLVCEVGWQAGDTGLWEVYVTEKGVQSEYQVVTVEKSLRQARCSKSRVARILADSRTAADRTDSLVADIDNGIAVDDKS